MVATGRRWKCGVCSTKAGDLVCGGCVTREAEKRRAERADRLRVLRDAREAAASAVQARGAAVQEDARLQKEAADECRLKDQVREVAKRVAEERIKVASAAFALKHHRDLLVAAESHLSLEQTSAIEMKEALLDGLRRHVEDAERTLRQRRWRKVVQLFVLLPVEPSIPPQRGGGRNATGRRKSRSPRSAARAAGAASGVEGGQVPGEGTGRSRKRGTGLPSHPAGQEGEIVSGVSSLVDLPLPNNGDYGQVPADVLMAALALVARLVAGVASCLGVSLPHPLYPAASTRYATISVNSSPRERSSQYPLCPLSKLTEIGVMGGGSLVCNTVGAFDTALDLLRSDVVHLCVEGASVPVDRLWPAEALLLNLWELQLHAVSELRRLSPMVDVPLPTPRDPLESSEGFGRRHTERTTGSTWGTKEGRVSSSSSSSSRQDDRRWRAPGMKSRLGFGGLVSTVGASPQPQEDPVPSPGVVVSPRGGNEDDEESTYEFIGGEGVAVEDSGAGTGDGRNSGAGAEGSFWGSRLAAVAGSGSIGGRLG